MDPDEPEPSRPDCELDQDGRIWIGPGAAERLRGCNIPEGAILSFGVAEPPAKPRRHHKARKRKEHKKMEPTETTTSAAPSASSTIPAETTVQPTPEKEAVVEQVVDDGAKVETHAETVAEPVPAGFDPMAVAQANPMLAFGLAILAVVGGGAGWKFWTKMSEQKHEQKMKELELQAQAQGLNGAQPPPCAAKQVETEAKVAALEARLGKMEKGSIGLPDDFDGEELLKRVAKVESALKRIGVKPAAGGGK